MRTVKEALAEYTTEELFALRDQAVKQLSRINLTTLRVIGGPAAEKALLGYFEKIYSRKVKLPVLVRETPEVLNDRHSAVCGLGRRIDVKLNSRVAITEEYAGIIK